MMMFGGTHALRAENYTPVNGDETTFNKYLIVDEDAKIPAIDFEFAIAPGQAIASDDGIMEVLAGVGSPTITSAVFTEGEAASSTAEAGVTLDAGEKFAKKVITVDFSGVSFDEPGIYRYLVTETSADQQGITYDTQAGTPGSKQRVMDVYVIDNNGSLEVDAYVLHENVDDIAATTDMGSEHDPAALADKSLGFVNEMASANLKFGKEVEGNQGSKDKVFEFTLVIGNAAPEATYVVELDGAPATSGSNSATIAANAGKANPTSITTDANGAATVKFYLADGQYVNVKGLPEDATYALTENAEDYKSEDGTDKVAQAGTEAVLYTAEEAAAEAELAQAEGREPAFVEGDEKVPATNAKLYSDATSGTIASEDIYTGFTNTRDGVIPTGLLMSWMLPALLGAVAVVGFFATRKKHQLD